MNVLGKLGTAIVAIAAIGSVASAQNVKLFSGNPSNSGQVLGTSGKVTTITGVQSTLFSLYSGAFVSDLYTIDFSAISNTLVVKDSSNTEVLFGNVSIITNSFDADGGDEDGPTFSVSGNLSFTSGVWLDPIRVLSAGSANGQGVSGYFSMSGNNGVAPSDVEAINMRASAVPEPGEWAAMGMLVSGLGGLVIRGRRRKLA